MTNHETRSNRAAEVIGSYSAAHHPTFQPISTIGELVRDLCHCAWRNGENVGKMLEDAQDDFRNDLTNEHINATTRGF